MTYMIYIICDIVIYILCVANPFPSAEDREALARQTGLSVKQVIVFIMHYLLWLYNELFLINFIDF